jgi:cytochrome c
MIGGFGTADMIIYEDFRDVIRCYNPCMGEFYLSQNSRLEVDTQFRKFTLSARQMEQQFGKDALSDSVQRLLGSGQGAQDSESVIGHCIEPNNDPGGPKAQGKLPWREVYVNPASLRSQQPPTPEEIRSLGSAIAPDGTGLPAGSGTVAAGRDVFAAHCARCHGPNADGDIGPRLVGGQGTLATPKPLKTVGSFWPYATTLWDYVNRAMPFDQPGLLKPDEVYAVVAYMLNLNGIIGNDQVMDAKSLPKVKMPNRDGFVVRFPDAM